MHICTYFKSVACQEETTISMVPSSRATYIFVSSQYHHASRERFFPIRETCTRDLFSYSIIYSYSIYLWKLFRPLDANRKQKLSNKRKTEQIVREIFPQPCPCELVQFIPFNLSSRETLKFDCCRFITRDVISSRGIRSKLIRAH